MLIFEEGMISVVLVAQVFEKKVESIVGYYLSYVGFHSAKVLNRINCN